MLDRDDYQDPDRFWILQAFREAKYSECLRRRIGAIVVTENLEWARGVSGHPRCQTEGCLRARSRSGEWIEVCRGSHAEQKALLRLGPSKCEGASLYVTHLPCTFCARLIVDMKIARVVYKYEWGIHGDISKHILNNGGVSILKFE